MSDTRSELKKLVPLYCDELNSLDLSLYENYEFSKDYLNKKEKLIKNQSRIYYPLIKTTGRRIASAIIAAAIMGTTTVAAYAPARNAVRKLRATTVKDDAAALYVKVSSMLDKLAKKNVIHKNKASNLTSKLALYINKL